MKKHIYKSKNAHFNIFWYFMAQVMIAWAWAVGLSTESAEEITSILNNSFARSDL